MFPCVSFVILFYSMSYVKHVDFPFFVKRDIQINLLVGQNRTSISRVGGITRITAT